MPGPYTIDASVFLNAFNPSEAGHEISFNFLEALKTRAVPIIAPTLLLPEVSAAIRRGRGDAELARQFTNALSQLPHLVLVTLDQQLALQASEVAAQHWLRGSDAVYVAVALRFVSPLVTLDREQYERGSDALQTLYPAQALKFVTDY